MDTGEAQNLISEVSQIPLAERWRLSEELGERHNLKSAARDGMRLWQLEPLCVPKKAKQAKQA
jgi:hypothetical protein